MAAIPGIRFLENAPKAAADPNRMDIAFFVGFLPLRGGPAAYQARVAKALALADVGWEDRVDLDEGTFWDVPIRVTSIEDVETVFDTGGRLDRKVRLATGPIGLETEITKETRVFGLNLDGQDQQVILQTGPITRADIKIALETGFQGVLIKENDLGGGYSEFEFQRKAPQPGSLTLYANDALGLPVAASGTSRGIGAPMGVALRSFFANGGREAIVVALGEPVPLFSTESERVAALSSLIGEGFGAGADSFAHLRSAAMPALPPDNPVQVNWHGLSHIHAFEDVTFVLIPDLVELVNDRAAGNRGIENLPRPKERFQPCTPDPVPALIGDVRNAKPASVSRDGLSLWARLAKWCADEISNISPEKILIVSAPMVDGDVEDGPDFPDVMAAVTTGADGIALAGKQLQVTAPWVVGPDSEDMPAGAAPADGLYAGLIAGQTLAKGAWQTIAGTRLPRYHSLYGATPQLDWKRQPQLSVIGYGPRGVTCLSDRTTDSGSFNQANIRRLTALILRAARINGRASVFQPNGPKFWRSTRLIMVTLLRGLFRHGALRGAREDDAFSVLCDDTTMSQQDIDEGRAIVDVTFAPAHSLEDIRISLNAATFTAAEGGA